MAKKEPHPLSGVCVAKVICGARGCGGIVAVKINAGGRAYQKCFNVNGEDQNCHREERHGPIETRGFIERWTANGKKAVPVADNSGRTDTKPKPATPQSEKTDKKEVKTGENTGGAGDDWDVFND